MRRVLLPILLLACCVNVASYAAPAAAPDDPEVGSLNKAERLEWFRDQGFGLFIHWSVDSQLGVVISHSLVGASPDYTQRFFDDLPKTFDPDRFHPLDYATRLAHLAGSSLSDAYDQAPLRFCHVTDTATTPFNIMNQTPFHRDITKEVARRFSCAGHRVLAFTIRLTIFLEVAASAGQDDRARRARRAAAQQSGADAIRSGAAEGAADALWQGGRALSGWRSRRLARSCMADRSQHHRHARSDQNA